MTTQKKATIKWILGIGITAAAWFGTVCFAAGVKSEAVAAVQRENDENQKQIKELKNDIIGIKEDLTEIKTDMKWVKTYLEKKSK